ncbi:MAG: glycosyltransferase [Chitinophagaceae bacterium]
MISVLICSANPVLLEQVTASIKDTIGTDFEILHFDNRTDKKGICQVYNELAQHAEFNHLCFVHEDVLFQTHDWGKKLIETFNRNSRVGLIGVAGSKYKSRYFSGWYCNLKELDCSNIVHRYSYGDRRHYLSPDDDREPQEVVCIDGVFMCCKKEVWQKIPFNEKEIKGFHFYDIDLSLRVALQYTVLVTYDIDMIHITRGGDYGNNWLQSAIAFHVIHKSQLPYSILKSVPRKVESIIIRLWLDWLKDFRITFSNKIKWIFMQNLHLHPGNYYSILKFLLYYPLGLKHVHDLFKKR